jgi:hypothetical protein
VSVTYRFEMVSERSDGKRTVAQRSAAVYETLEEALLQAGTDELISANVRPVDIIDGAHHGYEITAWGEPVADVDPATADSNPKDATKLAGRKDIGRAAAIVRELWTSPRDRRALAADEADLPIIDAGRIEAARSRGVSAEFAHTAARAEVTIERLRELVG